MAFTNAQKVAIRNWLGYSELYHDIDTRLESQMSEIGTRSPEAETFVIARLADLDDVRTRLSSALDNLDLIQAEDITFLGPVQLDTLRDHGRMLVQQMATIFQVVPKHDVFLTGDSYGGMIELG